MHLPAFLSRPAARGLIAAAALAPLGTLAAGATLYVALYNDAASYAESKALASQTAPMREGKARFVFTDLAPGRYALRVFADENGNGKLDTNLVGMPIERYGFSNDAKGNRGAPDFEAAALRIDADAQAVIHLR